MRPLTKLIAGVAAAAGLVALLLSLRGADDAATGGRDVALTEGKASASSAAIVATPTASTPPSASPAAPLPSHEGTAIDGAVTLDEHGAVVPTLALRRLFDYFLTGLGREEVASLRARMLSALRGDGLPESGVRQVAELFGRYLDYRDALQHLPAPGTTAASLRATYDARYALRRSVLGEPVAEAFFSREEAEDRYLIERRAIEEASDLPAWEREQRLALAEQQLPDEIRQARREAEMVVELNRRTEQLRAAGADQAQIQAMRERLAGPEAATRLQAFDTERAQWDQRMADYRRERARILASTGLAEADRQAAVDALIESRFTTQEAVRVRALDRIEAAGGG